MNTLAPGTVFGSEFRVVRLLRSGGMGSVYVVEQISTGRMRAMKVLAPEMGSHPEIQERFVREARIGARIDSDHIIDVVTAGIDESTGCPFLVMELLRGEDLEEISQGLGRLSIGDVAEILAQLGHGLERAHALGIVHRDIKPANVYLAAPRRRGAPFTVKVLDFGIAKAVAGHKLTGSQPLGTPLYMSPEQTERAAHVSPASDVWSLGLLSFRLLTGRDFWKAADESIASLIREIAVDDLPSASVRATEMGVSQYLPQGFDEWFGRCVAHDPEARFPEAGAAVQAFASLVPTGAPPGTLAAWLHDMAGSSVESAPTVEAPKITPRHQIVPKETMPGETASARPLAATRTREKGPRRLVAFAAIGAVTLVASVYAARERPFASFDEGADAAGNVDAARTTPAPAPSAASPGPVAAACPGDMVLIRGGNMFMGDLALENAKPPHKVTVTTFCLDRLEVTAKAYDACAEAGNCLKGPQGVHFGDLAPDERDSFSELCNARRVGREQHPINCVDWHMADNFCRTSGGRLPEGGGRLPTEAEWEYAARGSSQRAYPWGDEPPDATRLNACGAECTTWFEEHGMRVPAMYSENDRFPATAPVGSFLSGSGQHGLLDMAGNVWEWTADWYGAYSREVANGPRGPESGSERVVRGGAFNGSLGDWAKPAYRWKTTPDVYSHAIGFRCAKDLG